MIDEDRTMQLYGYTSDELKPTSHKPVVRVCEECGMYTVVLKHQCTELCRKCANIGNKCALGHHPTDETRKKVSLRLMGNTNSLGCKRTDETRKNMSLRMMGNTNSLGCKLADETRIKMSCAKQGIPVDEWDGYVRDQEYCHRFNESCREHNREKYGRTCFICGKTEEVNGRKLSVHHVDMNKDQGCNTHEWNLVPLCAHHHPMAHNDTWKARLAYLLDNVWV